MAYNVRCYFNTGLNGVNIYDTPARLESCKYVDLDSLNILQDWGLSSVRVRVPANTDISTIDYIKVGSYYYACNAPVMVATDVAEITGLVPDYITTNGGVSNIVILDGITERHTVGDDSMFKYTQSDEYTAPMEPLQIVTDSMLFSNQATNTETYVESTIDLHDLGEKFTTDSSGNVQFTGEGMVFTDDVTAVDSDNTVTVPYVAPIPTDSKTKFKLGTNETAVNSYNTGIYAIASQASADYSPILRGLSAVRALGVESAIISQYVYSPGFITIGDFNSDGTISTLTGGDDTQDATSLTFNVYGDLQNNRVAYGEYNKYGLITASGDKGEYLPEQIADSDDSYPTIRAVSDPRPSGKPYFRYLKYMGDESLQGFFTSCVAGLQWPNVPLTYTSASNSYLDRLNFSNGAQSSYNEYEYGWGKGFIEQKGNLTRGIGGIVGNVVGGIGNALTGQFDKLGENISGVFNNGANIAESDANYGLDTAHAADQYNLARQKEMQNFAISQSVVAPEIQFPFNADIIRDFIGNGVIPYRYRYSDNDAKRIDKLLTMYGYKDTVALTNDLFNQRTYFDYVRATGVSIGGDIPVWQKEAIAQQLNAGVRVWHTKPDPAHYASNPIVSAS